MLGQMPTDPLTSETIPQAIIDAANGPAEATVDGESVKSHSIRELIEADRYLRSKAVGANPFQSIQKRRLAMGDAPGRSGS